MTRRITVRSGSIPRKVVPPASAVSAAGVDTDAIHDNVAAEISAITEKASPVNADIVIIEDSTDSNNKKRVQVGNLPNTAGNDPDAIHDNVAAEISVITAKATPINADFLLIEDSAASNVKKRITIGDLPGGGALVTFKATDASVSTGSSNRVLVTLNCGTPASGIYRVDSVHWADNQTAGRVDLDVSDDGGSTWANLEVVGTHTENEDYTQMAAWYDYDNSSGALHFRLRWVGEGGTITFGLASDVRWERRIIAAGPF